MRSKVPRLEASLETVNCQISTSQAVFIAAEAECDQNRAIVDDEVPKESRFKGDID